ncbi:hypothetical protein DICSQDRAFT_183436 [Dichomitus squalens LYAD-421 SS1]|uniref:Uncharacterized protein n=1 Tax=Dichomitus squalens (strain LYAD-421) TaxID=732165 RepID=R7SLI5_DICSQ|nr:uncharacterized protein DICSQDRAFT_183436 [Dichomitus squalens LYAD-421 SS1]EJF57026.1 hypothetical protein DICSQDRAFT_183436 [Dichomitus squalens LYAD-421 SS1]
MCTKHRTTRQTTRALSAKSLIMTSQFSRRGIAGRSPCGKTRVRSASHRRVHPTYHHRAPTHLHRNARQSHRSPLRTGNPAALRHPRRSDRPPRVGNAQEMIRRLTQTLRRDNYAAGRALRFREHPQDLEERMQPQKSLLQSGQRTTTTLIWTHKWSHRCSPIQPPTSFEK